MLRRQGCGSILKIRNASAAAGCHLEYGRSSRRQPTGQARVFHGHAFDCLCHQEKFALSAGLTGSPEATQVTASTSAATTADATSALAATTAEPTSIVATATADAGTAFAATTAEFALTATNGRSSTTAKHHGRGHVSPSLAPASYETAATDPFATDATSVAKDWESASDSSYANQRYGHVQLDVTSTTVGSGRS